MLKAGPAGTPQSRSTDTPRRGGCVGASGAAASLTDPSVPSLPGEPRLRLRSLLQPRPRSAHGGEVAGVGSVAQVGAAEPGREKSRGAPTPGCERLREGSGRALSLKEVGGCNWERGAGGGTPGCLQWVLQPPPPPAVSTHRVFPKSAFFPPPKSGSGRRERGKVQHTTPQTLLCRRGLAEKPGRRPRGGAAGGTATVLGSRAPAPRRGPGYFGVISTCPIPLSPLPGRAVSAGPDGGQPSGLPFSQWGQLGERALTGWTCCTGGSGRIRLQERDKGHE